MWIKNTSKHKLFVEFYTPNMTATFKWSGTVFANLAWYRRTKDLVPLFDPKVHLFENSISKILAQLKYGSIKSEKHPSFIIASLLYPFFPIASFAQNPFPHAYLGLAIEYLEVLFPKNTIHFFKIIKI